MCGICGLFNFFDYEPADRGVLAAMTAVLAHRGPDAEGFHVDGPLGLGHRRLSIIDLSAAAAQPMSDPEGRYWLTYNGEIYNYIELRAALQSRGWKIRTKSDSEVLLLSFIEHGPACLAKLNGMFAFAVWDSKERRLFLARDHFGIKPLYYHLKNGRFTFASEVKALLKAPWIKAGLNPTALSDYLTFQYVLREDTLFKDIKKLEPGHWLAIDYEGRTKLHRYWRPEFGKVDLSEDQAVERVHYLIKDSLRLQVRSDVPVGAHLSGGLDTATVVCLADGLLPDGLKTFTAGFNEGGVYNDTGYARITAEHVGSRHFEIFPTADDFVDQLDRLMYHMDEPVAAPGSFAQYFVSKLASEQVTVALGGQGADEIFGGYARYYLYYLEAALRNGVHQDRNLELGLTDLIPGLPQLNNYLPLMQSFFKEDLFGDPASRYLRLIRRQEDLGKVIHPDLIAVMEGYSSEETFREMYGEPVNVDDLDRILNFEMTAWLPALLQVEDRTSMAWSLESRVPLLDHRLVELANSLPVSIKFQGGRLKHVMRRAVRDKLPPAIVSRSDKLGFPVPLKDWFAGPLKDWLCDRLLSRKSLERGLFRPEAIQSIVRSNDIFDRRLWGLLCLEIWAGLFIDTDDRFDSAV